MSEKRASDAQATADRCRSLARATADERPAPGNAVGTRRRFFFGASAVLAAPIALAASAIQAAAHGTNGHGATPTLTPPPPPSAKRSQPAFAALEDANAIRELQRAYVRHVDAGAHAAGARLFAEPARARLDETIHGLALEATADSARKLPADAPADFAGLVGDPDRQRAAIHARCVVRIEAPIVGARLPRSSDGVCAGRGRSCGAPSAVGSTRRSSGRTAVWKIESVAVRAGWLALNRAWMCG